VYCQAVLWLIVSEAFIKPQMAAAVAISTNLVNLIIVVYQFFLFPFK